MYRVGPFVAVFLTLMLLGLLTACGEPIGPKEKKVGPNGGTVVFADGSVTLVFPAGAVSQEVTVTVRPAIAPSPNSRVVGGTVYEFGPPGMKFAKPVQLSVRYDPTKLPAGVRDIELKLYEVVSSDDWEKVQESSVDIARHTVSGLINGFSIYGVLAVPVASVSVSPDTVTVETGATVKLTATPKDSEGNALSDRRVSWSSSKETVATVDSNGLVTGVTEGPVTITASCEGESETASITVVAPPGDLEVTTSTTGEDLDPDGYTVILDGSESRAIAVNGTVTFSGLAAGDHTVQLSGEAPNCTVALPNPLTVSVPSGGTTQTTIAVSCTATNGNLQVTTSTTGEDLDPDGYTVILDGSESRAIAVNGWVTFSGVAAGDHAVELSGVAPNCTVTPPNPRTVGMLGGGTAQTTFEVTCPSINQRPSAEIVSPADSAAFLEGQEILFAGIGRDAEDGLLGGSALLWTSDRDGQLGTGMSVLRDDLSVGVHSITLTVTDSEGASDADSITITLSEVMTLQDGVPVTDVSGSQGSQRFYKFVVPEMGIAGRTTRVAGLTRASGSGRPKASAPKRRTSGEVGDGFLSVASERLLRVSTSGSLGWVGADLYVRFAAIPDLSTYDCRPYLGGNDELCEFSDPAPGEWFIMIHGRSGYSGVTLLVEFITVSTGDLKVTSSTMGEDFDPDGYTVTVDETWSEPLGVNASVTFWDLASGGHEVALSDVASNCAVSGANRRIVEVPFRGTAETIFDVTCQANELPTVTISSPPDGATYTYGETVTFEGLAEDPEDGLLSGDRLIWTDTICYGLCWEEQIGTGTSFQHSDLPSGYHSVTLTATDSRGAQDTAGVGIAVTRTKWSAVVAGDLHTCGVSSDVPYCWGDNSHGQLSDETTTDRHSPVPVSDELAFSTMSAGGYHTCGLTTDGTAYCWGGNNHGELGDGSTTDRPTPVPVSAGLAFGTISTGAYHTCGITTAGSAYCWGRNWYGEIGDGTTTERHVPAPVSGGLAFASISAGAYHTCGITTDVTSFCWGSNSYGELGEASTTDRSAPVLVGGGLAFTSISAGAHHSCGITPGGSAYCWGRNWYGEIGDGTTTDRYAPAPVSEGLAFSSLSAGGFHTCGATDGGAFCWGNNGHGQLGDGTTANSSTPVSVSGGLTFGSIGSGDMHTCGVTSIGAAYCWGSNGQGQLGDGTTTDRSTPARLPYPDLDLPDPGFLNRSGRSEYDNGEKMAHSGGDCCSASGISELLLRRLNRTE